MGSLCFLLLTLFVPDALGFRVYSNHKQSDAKVRPQNGVGGRVLKSTNQSDRHIETKQTAEDSNPPGGHSSRWHSKPPEVRRGPDGAPFLTEDSKPLRDHSTRWHSKPPGGRLATRS